MSPILDASGQPLPSTRPTPSVLDELCNNRDRTPKGWSVAEEHFDLILNVLERDAGPLLDMMSGKVGLDARTQDGQNLVRTLVDVGLSALVFRHRAQRGAARDAQETEDTGGQRAPS